jgi:hypothetical protein
VAVPLVRPATHGCGLQILPGFAAEGLLKKEREAVVAKVSEAFATESNYLAQKDLGNRHVPVIIESLSYETVGQGQDQEDKWVVHFQGKNKGMVLNKTNAETIGDILGDDEMDNWPGHKIVLYVDKNVMMGGRKVGGIRVMEYRGPQAAPKPAAVPKPATAAPKPKPAPAAQEQEREPGDDTDDELGF